MRGRTRRLYVAPGGGKAFIDTPDEHLSKLPKALGPGWRPATRREWIWYELTRPQISYLSFVAIIVIGNALYNWLNP